MPNLFRLSLNLLFLCLLALSGVAAATGTFRYTDNNDGTVTDTTTGLTWMRCAMGQTWTGSICDGAPATYPWDQANAITNTFAGHNDWRLPTIRELTTITELTRSSPAIDTSVFPGAPSSVFWSGSPVAGGSGLAWDVGFDGGYGSWGARGSGFAVRLVRAGQMNLPFASLLNNARPTTDYVDNGDGTVTHAPTCLIWKRCAEGQGWNGATCTGTAGSYTWDQANSLSNFWRLPTEEELRSLVDYTIASPGPTINTTWFLNAPSSDFWSGSPVAGYSDYAWSVSFDGGYDDWDYRLSYFAVRLVRAGQCIWNLHIERTGTGGGAVTSSPAGINCGSDCTEDYNPGTSVILTASVASGSTFTGWSGGGCSGTGTCAVTMNTAQTVTASFTRITYALTVNKSGAGSGTVTSSPSGINCGTGCATTVRSYNGGTSVVLTASAASGSTFAGWNGGGCSGTGTCAVTLNAAKTVTAAFKANQTIGALSFSPATLLVNGTTTTSATATSGLGVTFSSSTPRVCTVNGRTVTGIAAGTCTIAANQAGNANYNAAPRVTRNLTVITPSPDFVVTGVTFTPASPMANSTFSVNVTVRNQGTAAGDGGQLTLWTNQANDQNCATPGDRSLAIGTLAAGASRVLTVSNLAAGSAGTKTLRTFVDSECVMLESNPDNNQSTRTYTVVSPPAPDLVVTGITLTPTSPTTNTTFNVRVTVRNQGTTAAASGAKLAIWTHQPTDQNCGANGNNSAILGALLNGSERTVNFTGLSAGSVGSKTLRVFVDSNCLINESTETNNQRTLIYTVR
ncbi:conserved exported hypothetical protein [Gammaproteobacteria bacterium]